ncbi:hypothetical protein [Pontibacter litorisediminis]|uniref:hypothetical protein n=1 Tax=Pontibacter litorisediminis TaxID=1846260 RepID=UPI0023EB3B86|nr:hypothetical protein [Pontibacter litorisediminis]
MRHTFILLLLLLLGSCATQRQAEKFFEENPEKLAEYVDKNEAYTREYGKAYAAKHFPPRLYPPAIYAPPALRPDRLQLGPLLADLPRDQSAVRSAPCPACTATYITQTIYLPDTVQLDSLSRELRIERMANGVIRQRLQETEADRDYWRDLNRKKRWALVAMAVFAVLYILFKLLAARVRDTEA